MSSRALQAANITEIESASVQPVILVKIEFDTPVYVHSGFGTITFDSNDYTGVGSLGSIAGVEDAEDNTPQPVQISLSAIPAGYIAEALDSTTYGDRVTLYHGFRGDDGLLVADPEVPWKGYLEYASVEGETETVTLHCQHYLTVLNKKRGGRFTDEDLQRAYFGDLGLQYIHLQNGLTFPWGKEGSINSPYIGGPRAGGGTNIRER